MSKYLVFVYVNGNVVKRMFTDYDKAYKYALQQNQNFNYMVRILHFNTNQQKWESCAVIYSKESF